MNHACFEGESLNEIYDKVMAAFQHAPDQPSQFGLTKEILNCFIEIKDPRRRFIIAPQRKHSMIYLLGEFIWYMSGERHVQRISNYSGFWERLVDRDGTVNSNYGDKIFYREMRAHETQFKFVNDELTRDPSSRRAVMLLNLGDDYSQMHSTMDFPCTMYLHFIIREGKLDLIVHMRSNDFILGFNNDMPFFSILQEMVAVNLNIPLGTYFHFSDSMHLYERNFDQLGHPATPPDKKREAPFYKMVYEDILMAALLPGYEAKIRTAARLFELNRLPHYTPFTQSILFQLVTYWKQKGIS